MARWREPIAGVSVVNPAPHDFSTPNIKTHVEHETDVVLAGYQDGPWFCPTHRLWRRFEDGVVVETHKLPLGRGEEKLQLRQSTPMSQ